eukprot:6186135-Pyramimonas_sp.AAC.1
MQFYKLSSTLLWLIKEADGRVDFSIAGAADSRRARAHAPEFFVVHNRKVDMQLYKLNSKILWLFKGADERVDC